jgi:hypothetical protein
MLRLKKLFSIVLSAAALWGFVQSELEAAPRRIACGKGHRLSIVDLDMSPDPVNKGERIRAWRLTVKVDGSGECDTVFQIREQGGDRLVGQEMKRLLKPGINEIEFPAREVFRFRDREHCFEVIADIEGTKKRVDAGRRFCAREVRGGNRWSMKEPGDRPVGR